MSMVSTAGADDVLIVGAGMSGLLLAQGLKHRNVPFQVFERDAALASRGHRYRIMDGGLKAFEKTLSPQMWSLFQKTHAGRIEPPALAVLDASTGQQTDTWRLGDRSVNVDRPWVRELLLNGIEDHVHFGKASQSYELLSDGGRDGVRVHFADGSAAQGRILIGADGVGSKVRKQLFPDVKLVDTERCCIWGRTPLTDEFRGEFGHEEVLRAHFAIALDKKNPNQSMLFAPIVWPHGGKLSAIEGCNLSDQESYVFWVLSFPPEASVPLLTQEQRRAYALRLAADWDSCFRRLLEMQAQSAVTPIHSNKPDISPWPTDTRITFAGDSIHAMAPSGGSGGETAAVDVGQLCDVLSASRTNGNWDSAVLKVRLAQFELDMRERAKKAIEYSFQSAVLLWGGSKDWSTYPEVSN
ncbi:hypothetical protein INS49_015203 [Diaporthe citri]|uniref:uncharacterized protein n=1 Tax=Diaporthe citri TaxID=83186 RepID=UPI001C82045F|nr:uncharacterized protein INS49_015203 [Diaporthe citri]KAG6357325.1 hypothetical protein INS49_015203 [Diaporthe citri]